MKHDVFLYILVMTAVTLAIRLVPLTLLRRPIKSRFLRSFPCHCRRYTDAGSRRGSSFGRHFARLGGREPFSSFRCLLCCRFPV